MREGRGRAEKGRAREKESEGGQELAERRKWTEKAVDTATGKEGRKGGEEGRTAKRTVRTSTSPLRCR